LLRKDQVDTKEDIEMLKDELWKRRLVIKAEIVILRGNQIVKETTLLEKIQKNNIVTIDASRKQHGHG